MANVLRMVVQQFLSRIPRPSCISHESAGTSHYEKGKVNDTQRLDWLLNHPGAEWDNTREHWGEWAYIIWFSESYHYLARGKDWRECIDNAIAGNVEKNR